MREAVGGTLLFYIVIGFLFVYIIFIGVIMNYASTYRASNYIVSRIEEYEANVDVNSDNFIEKVRDTYRYKGALNYCCRNNSNGSVYKVEAYVNFELPLIGVDFDIPVVTETKTIYGITCEESQINKEC